MFGPMKPAIGTHPSHVWDAVEKLFDLLHVEVKTLREEVQRLEQKVAWHEAVTHGQKPKDTAPHGP